jgi:hypothetical protein
MLFQRNNELTRDSVCRDLKESVTAQRWVAFSFTEPAGVYLTVYFHAIGRDVGRF